MGICKRRTPGVEIGPGLHIFLQIFFLKYRQHWRAIRALFAVPAACLFAVFSKFLAAELAFRPWGRAQPESCAGQMPFKCIRVCVKAVLEDQP